MGESVSKGGWKRGREWVKASGRVGGSVRKGEWRRRAQSGVRGPDVVGQISRNWRRKTISGGKKMPFQSNGERYS